MTPHYRVTVEEYGADGKVLFRQSVGVPSVGYTHDQLVMNITLHAENCVRNLFRLQEIEGKAIVTRLLARIRNSLTRKE